MTINKLRSLEDKLKQEIEDARNLSDRGVFNPSLIPHNVDGTVTELVSFSASKLTSLQNEEAHLDRHLQPLKNQIKDSESKLLIEWNSKERTIKNRAEAEEAIRYHDEHIRFKLKSLVMMFFFLAELVYGYHIFKSIVLPDDKWENHGISFLVGCMILGIGYYVKKVPNETLDLKKYEFSKRIVHWVTGIIVTTFIICLVQQRETVETFDLATATTKVSTGNWLELIFSLSLICSIVLIATCVEHFNQRLPWMLVVKRRDEGRELLNWYASEHFDYKKACREYDDHHEKLHNVVRPALAYVQEILSRYTPSYKASLIRKAITEYLQGACTVPLTAEKEQGRKKAEELLFTFQTENL